MFDYNGCFQSAIAALKCERRYRVFADLERMVDSFPMRSGTARVANGMSLSGARTTISAWARIRKCRKR
jgi:hypothetical protein